MNDGRIFAAGTIGALIIAVIIAALHARCKPCQASWSEIRNTTFIPSAGAGSDGT